MDAPTHAATLARPARSATRMREAAGAAFRRFDTLPREVFALPA